MNRHRDSLGPRALADVLVRQTLPVLMVGLMMLVATMPALSQETVRVLRFEADGRVRLEVYDPEGHRLGRDVNEIDGAVFEEIDNGMVMEIADPTLGDYELHVNADGSANRIHLFDVWVTDGVSTISLAERELIMNVPSDPYIIRVTEAGLSDVTGTIAGSDGDGGSFPTWIIIVVAVVVVGGGATFLLLRSRRRSP